MSPPLPASAPVLPPAEPIDFAVASKIEGIESQALTIKLGPNQSIRADTGSLLFMTEGIEMETEMQGGVMAGMKRFSCPK